MTPTWTSAFVLYAFCCNAFADTFGDTYAISEPDVLNEIETRAQDFSPDAYYDSQETWTGRTSQVQLPKATEIVVRHVDISIVLDNDIVDHEGRVISAKGTVVNPLEQIAMPHTLYIIDNDPDVEAWVVNHLQPGDHIFMSNGTDVIEARDRLEHANTWMLTKTMAERFRIERIPTRIIVEHQLLVLHEGYR